MVQSIKGKKDRRMSCIFKFVSFILGLLAIATAMSEHDYRAQGCIACGQQPDCVCDEGYECSIQDRTCQACYKVICKPIQPLVPPPQSQSVAGELFSTLPPLPPPVIPAGMPTSTIVASNTCVFPSTMLVSTTSVSTMKFQQFSTVTIANFNTVVQTQFTTTSVPVQIAGTIMVTQPIPTATSSYCITSFQVATSSVQVAGYATVVNTFPATQVQQYIANSTIGQLQFISSTMTMYTTATVFPIKEQGNVISSIAPVQSTCITSTFSTACTTFESAYRYFPRRHGYRH